ncbi:meiosis-specific with OB domain-containing protein [Planococcus citri]|uniref:meiosis-specific with OB domain-containing protein n=1 Tax=Planococcus citri TaxID=170843 RepID=UPI0031F72893
MDSFNTIRVKIRDIGPGTENLLLTGLIIRKQEPRVVQMKKDGSERCVWSFTLRDSPSDLINVTIWGLVNSVRDMYNKFQVGDVVSVLNGKAVFRKVSDRDDSFQPAVTSSFYISLDENQSEVIPYNGLDEKMLKALLNIPSKPAGNFLTISDVHRNGEILRGQYINLLAAVQDVGDMREFQSRDGRNCRCLEVRLVDQSYSTLLFTVWGNEMISQCKQWVPQNTVLFLADVRADWSNFRKIMMVSSTGRTIVTENPPTNAAQNLKAFISSTSFRNIAKIDQLVNKYADPSVINTVTSCAGVLTKAMDEKQNEEFTALVYAAINSFDVDESESFIVTKCAKCNSKVDPSLGLCLNADCCSGMGMEKLVLNEVYDLKISLIDHTGMLNNCKLTNSLTQKMIGVKASVFKTFSETEKTNIKWKYQLKYCAARLVILPLRERLPAVSVLSIDMISLGEYSTQIPMC